MNAARAVLLALLVGWVVPALALVAVPPLTGRVVDQTGTLSSGDIASLAQTLKNLETRKGSQIAVLIVPTTDGEAIEQFSLRVAEAWKIGRKKIDDGAVLVIAKNDRHLRIEVGYGLEGALTDVTTKRIIDEEITPKFKSGDFAGGVSAGIATRLPLRYGEFTTPFTIDGAPVRFRTVDELQSVQWAGFHRINVPKQSVVTVPACPRIVFVATGAKALLVR